MGGARPVAAGPGLGPIVGPAGTFAPLPYGAKWVLCLAMLLGRPIGGIVFGRISDRLGRTRTTRIAIAGTAACALGSAAWYPCSAWLSPRPRKLGEMP